MPEEPADSAFYVSVDDEGKADPAFAALVEQAIKQEGRKSMAGILLGGFTMLGGVVLFAMGTAGSVTWTASTAGVRSDVSNAAPGAILFIVGLGIIWGTTQRIKLRRRRQ